MLDGIIVALVKGDDLAALVVNALISTLRLYSAWATRIFVILSEIQYEYIS